MPSLVSCLIAAFVCVGAGHALTITVRPTLVYSSSLSRCVMRTLNGEPKAAGWLRDSRSSLPITFPSASYIVITM